MLVCHDVGDGFKDENHGEDEVLPGSALCGGAQGALQLGVPQTQATPGQNGQNGAPVYQIRSKGAVCRRPSAEGARAIAVSSGIVACCRGTERASGY